LQTGLHHGHAEQAASHLVGSGAQRSVAAAVTAATVVEALVMEKTGAVQCINGGGLE